MRKYNFRNLLAFWKAWNSGARVIGVVSSYADAEVTRADGPKEK